MISTLSPGAVALFPFESPIFAAKTTLMIFFHYQLAFTLLLSQCFAQLCSSEIGPSYSGFKVVQIDRFSLYPLSKTHQVLLCHCVHGQLRHSKRFDLDSSSIFKTSLCFLDNDPLSPKQFAPQPGLGTTFTSLLSVPNQNNTWLGFFPETKPKDDSQNVCYRLARRNLYSRLSLNIYVPHTYIGGFYECKGLQEQCPVDNFSMIAPLVADDPTNHWYFFESNLVGFVRYTQFLKTASQLETNVLFKSFLMESWEQLVDINESYTLRV